MIKDAATTDKMKRLAAPTQALATYTIDEPIESFVEVSMVMLLAVLEFLVMCGHCRSSPCSMKLPALGESGPPMAQSSMLVLASAASLGLALLPHDGLARSAARRARRP